MSTRKDYNKYLLALREFLLTHRRLVWVGLGIFFIFAAAGGGVVYRFYQQQETETAEFYKLILHDTAGADSTAASQQLQEFVEKGDGFLGSKEFLNTYVNIIRLKQNINKDSSSATIDMLNNEAFVSNDQLMDDFLKIDRAKIYLKLGKYDEAIVEASNVLSYSLEDLQLITLAEINYASGNLDAAKNNLDQLISSHPNSLLSPLAKSYIYLLN